MKVVSTPLGHLWRHRELVWMLTSRELRARYKGSVLGLAWSLVNPFLMTAIYAFVFGVVLHVGGKRYWLVLVSGLIPWTYLQSGVNAATFALVSNANLLKKVAFPRVVLPLSCILAAGVHFALGVVVVLGLGLFAGASIGWGNLALIPISALNLTTLALGIGLLTSVWFVYYRDLEHVVNLLFLVWFYLTPILYTTDMVPPSLRWVVQLNGAAATINGFQWSVGAVSAPAAVSVFGATIFSLLVLALGWSVFHRSEAHLAEEV